MDNNIPFYPLLHPQREVDVIIAIDSSADIQNLPYFERAEGYVKRRGIVGWPTGSGWPKRPGPHDGSAVPEDVKTDLAHEQDSQRHEDWVKDKYGLGHVTVFSSAT